MPVPEPATIPGRRAFSDLPNMGARHPFPWSHPHRLRMKKGTFPKRKADAGLQKKGHETEQAKSKENHYAEVFLPENKVLSLPPDDMSRKDSTMPSS